MVHRNNTFQTFQITKNINVALDPAQASGPCLISEHSLPIPAAPFSPSAPTGWESHLMGQSSWLWVKSKLRTRSACAQNPCAAVWKSQTSQIWVQTAIPRTAFGSSQARQNQERDYTVHVHSESLFSTPRNTPGINGLISYHFGCEPGL